MHLVKKESALTLKIANYCKEELEKYDVNVVMTRTTDTRPSENAAQDLIERVMTAKKAGGFLHYQYSLKFSSEYLGSWC